MLKPLLLPTLAVAMLGLYLIPQAAQKAAKEEIDAAKLATRKTIPVGVAPKTEAVITAFFSSDQLAADHPFRRLESLRTLKESYDSQIEFWSARSRDIREQERQARQDAKKAEKALRKRIEKQFASYMQSLAQGLLARVDSRLGAEKFSRLEKLQLAIDALLPQKKRTEIDGLVEETVAVLKKDRVGKASNNEKTYRRWQKRQHRLAREMRGLYADRVAQTWEKASRELSQHDSRLGKGFEKKLRKALERLEKIRNEVRQRITCAVERSQKAFSTQLRRRLQKHRLPAKGELQAAIADLAAQIEAMTDRFITRSETAVQEFEEQVAHANAKLVESCRLHANPVTRALAKLMESLKRSSSHRPVFATGTAPSAWQSESQVNRVYDRLRAEMRKQINWGRNEFRAELVPLMTEFKEHRLACRQSWHDLSQLLGSIRGQACGDCWRLDGPHLDGRFPRKNKLRNKITIAKLAGSSLRQGGM